MNRLLLTVAKVMTLGALQGAAQSAPQALYQPVQAGTLVTDDPAAVGGYNRGFGFTPNKAINITSLGGFFNGTYTVALFDRADGSQLASVSVTAANSWSYSPLAQPVALVANHSYSVAFYTDDAGVAAYRMNDGGFHDLADASIDGSCFSNAPTVEPCNNFMQDYYMWGLVDIQYDLPTSPGLYQAAAGSVLVTGDPAAAAGYNRGFTFTPNKAITVTTLGGLFNGTFTVTLYDRWSGDALASASVTGANDWAYTALTTPVTLMANHPYSVGVFTDVNGAAAYRVNDVTPRSVTDASIDGGCYSSDASSDPCTGTISNYFMWGLVDLQYSLPTAGSATPLYQPVAAGTLVSGDPAAVGGYTRGFGFTPNKELMVQSLGGMFNGTFTVSLYDRGSGDQLASVTVTSANRWAYAPLTTPIYLAAGHPYSVAVYSTTDGATSYRVADFTPKATADATIDGGCYSSASDVDPCNDTMSNYYMWGLVDLQYSQPSADSSAFYQPAAGGTLYTDQAAAVGGYNRGYAFTPNKSITITSLGGLFNGTYTVILYDRDSGGQLASAVVTAADDWSYSPISPLVTLTAGHHYSVGFYTDDGGVAAYRTGEMTPMDLADGTIDGSCYSGSAAAEPCGNVMRNDYMWGLVDFRYRP